MIRRAEPGEEARLEGFLAGFPDTSMFLRGNLAAHGLGPSSHPHASAFWLAERENGAITTVLGRTNEGYLMAQAPDAPPALWESFAQVLQGRDVIGMTGDAPQVEAALAGLGMADAPFVINHIEPLYRLDLAKLAPCEAVVRKPVAADISLLRDWFAGYFYDLGFVDSPERAAADAVPRAERVVAEGRTWLLVEDGAPVAMAGINAEVKGMVQLGGVFVPEAARNRGLGRKVTAALLVEAKREGTETAILFANNPAAARSYEAIGFARVGTYRIAILPAARAIGVVA